MKKISTQYRLFFCGRYSQKHASDYRRCYAARMKKLPVCLRTMSWRCFSVKRCLGLIFLAFALLTALLLSGTASANSWNLKGKLLQTMIKTHDWDDYILRGNQADPFAVMQVRTKGEVNSEEKAISCAKKVYALQAISLGVDANQLEWTARLGEEGGWYDVTAWDPVAWDPQSPPYEVRISK